MEDGGAASPLFWRGEHKRDWVLIDELSPVRRFLYVSPGVTDAIGYTPEELYADPDLFEKNLYPDDVARVQEKIRTSPTAHTIRTRFVRKDGAVVWIEADTAPILDESGKVKRLESLCRVIDSRIQGEDEVERLQTQFLAAVANELREPLASIKGAISVARDVPHSPDPASMLWSFAVIEAQSERLLGVVNDLIDMSRIEAGVLTFSPESLDIGLILRHLNEDGLYQSRPFDVELRLSDDLPRVAADPRRVAQVVLSLADVAARLSPPGIPVEIETSHDSDCVIVLVRARGSELPEAQRHRLFKKYSRIDEGDQNLSCTGLRLAIAKGIVDAHRGQIWATGDAGRGMVLGFKLPIAAEAGTSSAVPASGTSGTQKAWRRRRILILDDDRQVVRYLERILQAEGFTTFVAADPATATSLLLHEELDLVMADFELPRTTGLDLLQHIRKLSRLPVIFLADIDHKEDMVRAVRMGADDYIIKPFSSGELLARLEVVLRRGSQAQVGNLKSFTLGDLRVDFPSRSVSVCEQPVHLTHTEYRLLHELATNAGMVLTYGHLLDRIWGPDYAGDIRLLRAFVVSLRQKLGDAGPHYRYIVTERSVGYKMPSPKGRARG